ncbi:MAG: hypothetical protein ACPGJV_09240 [Bacteriovoracaceae bacterium]
MLTEKLFFIKFENNHDLEGRFSVYQTDKDYQVQIDIVFKRNRKIYQHIGFVSERDEQEAVDLAYMKLKDYFEQKSDA